MSCTVGSALTLARDEKHRVELLVEGYWIGGHVSAVDGFGVVLNQHTPDHAVIRIESTAAVKVDAENGQFSMPLRRVSSDAPRLR